MVLFQVDAVFKAFDASGDSQVCGQSFFFIYSIWFEWFIHRGSVWSTFLQLNYNEFCNLMNSRSRKKEEEKKEEEKKEEEEKSMEEEATSWTKKEFFWFWSFRCFATHPFICVHIFKQIVLFIRIINCKINIKATWNVGETNFTVVKYLGVVHILRNHG